MAASTSKKPAAKKPAPAKTRRQREDDDDVVAFNLSKPTSKAIDAAVKGLNKKQQDRVMEAIDAVGDEIGAKVGRWVENSFARNSNDLLQILSPILAKDGLWSELRAIWTFLEELGVKVDQKRMAKAVEKDLGAHIAGHYRDVVAGAKETPPAAGA
jgi:hypothetical protein